MASPSPLPMESASSETWNIVRSQWVEIDANDSDFMELGYELVRPYVLDAIRRVSLTYSYLLRESDLVLQVMSFLKEKRALPATVDLFGILLESTILRAIHLDLRSATCDLRDPLAPWVEFSRRANRLRRSFRRYFLVFLPPSELAPEIPGVALRKPSRAWAKLWDRLTMDIPVGNLPETWRQTRDSAEGESTAVSVISPSIIIPGRSVTKQFGEILHRAAGLAESKRIGRTELILPKGVIPQNLQAFSGELQALLQSTGGLPQSDQNLQEALKSILSLRAGDKNAIYAMDPELLLDCSEQSGFDPFKTFMVRGAISDRSGDSDRALWEFHKGISAAGSRKQIGQGLANLAIQALVAHDFARAKSWIMEAWQYSPNCSFVVSCMSYVRQTLIDQEGQRSENIA